MLEWLKKWLLKKELQKIGANSNTSDAILAISEEYLKRANKEHAEQLRIAQRLNQANIMRAQTRDLKAELRNSLDDDGEDEYDEEDEDPDVPEDLEGFAKDLLMKAVKGSVNRPAQQPSTAGLPSQNAAQSQIPQHLVNIWDKMTPQQREKALNLVKDF